MKKILLLFSEESVKSGLADPLALTNLLSGAGEPAKFHWAYFEDLVFYVDNNKVAIQDTRQDIDLSEYDTIYLRFMGHRTILGHALAVARYCQLKNIRLVDSEAARIGSQNKITQYINLHGARVPIPRTLMALPDILAKKYAEYGFEFPFIMKAKGGTRGADNFLIKNEAELTSVVADYPEETFILQEYIVNTGDYRLIVIEDKVALAIWRSAQEGTHLNNTSQGGAATLVPLAEVKPEVLDAAVRAAQYYGRQIAGVDMVEDADGKFYCFEVNRAPQIEHASFEKEKAAIVAQYLAQD